MKKRLLNILAGSVLALFAISSFFEKSINVDYLYSKLVLSILTLLAGIFLVYSNYDADNKAVRTYSIMLAALVVILGLLGMLSSLLPGLFSISVQLLAYKAVLLFASISILLSDLK